MSLCEFMLWAHAPQDPFCGATPMFTNQVSMYPYCACVQCNAGLTVWGNRPLEQWGYHSCAMIKKPALSEAED